MHIVLRNKYYFGFYIFTTEKKKKIVKYCLEHVRWRLQWTATSHTKKKKEKNARKYRDVRSICACKELEKNGPSARGLCSVCNFFVSLSSLYTDSKINVSDSVLSNFNSFPSGSDKNMLIRILVVDLHIGDTVLPTFLCVGLENRCRKKDEFHTANLVRLVTLTRRGPYMCNAYTSWIICRCLAKYKQINNKWVN